MDYTWIVSTPTSSSGEVLMSVGAVRHRFLVAVFIVAFCPCCWCRISLPERVQCLCNFSLSFSCLTWFVCLWTSKQKDGRIDVTSLTLHSGQSYPGTPEQPGSRTGTHPVTEEGLLKQTGDTFIFSGCAQSYFVSDSMTTVL